MKHRSFLLWWLILAAPLLSVSCNKDFDFSKMTEDEQIDFLIKTVDSVYEKGDVFFKECKTASEFGNRLGEITSIKGVSEAYVEGNTVFIRLVNGETLSYLYSPAPEFPGDQTELMTRMDRELTRAGEPPVSSRVGHLEEYKTACFINQQAMDESRDFISQFMFPYAKRALKNIGIEVTEELSPTRDFFKQGIFQYDIIYLITHGCYDSVTEKHWLLTSEPLNWFDKVREVIDEIFLDSTPDNIGTIWEVHQGDSVLVKYLMISDEQIASSKYRFPNDGRAIVFNTACQSLMGKDGIPDYKMWDVFRQHGAGIYLGYDQTNTAGKIGGMYYFGRLASGMSVRNAYDDLPSSVRKNRVKEDGKEFDASLLFCSEDMESICLTAPVTMGNNDCSDKDGISVRMTGTASLFSPSYIVYNNSKYTYDFSTEAFRYGFCISETPDFTAGRMLTPLSLEENGCDYKEYQVSFSTIADNLEAEKLYYYWSYLFDGHDYVFGERSSFVTKRINQIIPEELLEELEKYIPIYDGINPPNVEGQYVMSPEELVYDSTNGYSVGYVFSDLYFQCYNQNMENNTLDYREEQGNTSGVGTGAFISGEGDDFSVFFNTEKIAPFSDYTVYYKTALVLSGTKTAEGIKNLSRAFVVVEKSSDPEHHIIPEGAIRVLKDGDGLCSLTTHFNSPARIQEKIISSPFCPLGVLDVETAFIE